MCIAIVKPKDKTISKEVLKTCSINNPDGMGFAYVDNGTVYICKFLNDFEKFYEKYSEVEHKSNMLIHFRIATHGQVNLENCHPFKLNNHMALIHNGIITGYGDKDKKSDTRDFIDKVIGNISWKLWKNPAFIELVGKTIGYSKFGILDTNDNYYIVNEKDGYWTDGVWYSNKSYKPKQAYTTYTKKENKNNNKESKRLPIKESDVKVVYRCSKCKEEFTDTGYKWSRRCPKCKSYLVDDIGWVEDGKKYYYDQCWYDEDGKVIA